MIGYVTVGTNDLDKTCQFFDALFAPLGLKRLMEMSRGVMWGKDFSSPFLGAMKPFDGEVATVGNGTMIALTAKSRAQVDEIYQLALSLGAVDEGAPGERMPGFYAGYFRTPDGHKMNIFKMG